MNKLTPRVRVFIYAGLALLALVLLAGSLSTLQMAPGEQFGIERLVPQVVDSSVPDDWVRTIIAIFRVLLIIAWIALPAYLILLIFSKEARKKLLRDLAIFLPILILLYFLSTQKQTQRATEDLQPRMFGTMDISQLEGTPAPPPPAFTPPPAWVTTAATWAIAVGIALVFAAVVYFAWRRSRQESAPLKMVEREARAALDAIEAGGDVRDVIIRCYLQMLEALREYRAIQRGRDMTPSEFEVFLTQRGMPREPIHQLTALFEQVRYGGRNPGRQDERTAISSLSAIVSACEKMRS